MHITTLSEKALCSGGKFLVRKHFQVVDLALFNKDYSLVSTGCHYLLLNHHQIGTLYTQIDYHVIVDGTITCNPVFRAGVLLFTYLHGTRNAATAMLGGRNLFGVFFCTILSWFTFMTNVRVGLGHRKGRTETR